MYAAETAFQARPVLKWAGGKSRLLPELLRHAPNRFAGYHEPLMGGGALFFALASAQAFSRATLSDVNPHLMDVYLALRDDVDGVIAALRQHEYSEAHYYQVRALRPEDLPLAARAARIIFLNKTCYNGLYRENRAGQFNVPFGRYRNPTICDEANLRAAALVLQGVDIGVRPFPSILDLAQPGDFVYFDPPYHPVSATARFTQYSKHGFTAEDQRALRDVFAALQPRGVKAMLSNSDTPFIRELYAGFHIHEVQANRAINSRADRRGKITELIICNYP
jgi:DNA adenine methylase